MDASPLEELCTEAKLVVAVNRSGELCGVQKGQEGGIEPSLLLEMIQVRIFLKKIFSDFPLVDKARGVTVSFGKIQ